MKSLHKEDLVVDGQTMRQQMIENFKDIEDEDVHDHKDFNQEVQNRKRADKGLQSQIDKLNTRCTNLENEKASHQDVKVIESEWMGRAKHIYLGDDHKAIRDVILDMKKKGEI